MAVYICYLTWKRRKNLYIDPTTSALIRHLFKGTYMSGTSDLLNGDALVLHGSASGAGKADGDDVHEPVGDVIIRLGGVDVAQCVGQPACHLKKLFTRIILLRATQIIIWLYDNVGAAGMAPLKSPPINTSCTAAIL